jgi:hypothetical protein
LYESGENGGSSTQTEQSMIGGYFPAKKSARCSSAKMANIGARTIIVTALLDTAATVIQLRLYLMVLTKSAKRT